VASRPSLGRRLLYSLIPVVVVFSAAELGLRGAGWPKVEAAFEHNSPFWTADPDLDEFPMNHGEENTTFPVTTNDEGLRAPVHAPDKPAGKQRIMTLGCSTTFGWGVADAESYPARLETLIHEKGRDDIEVINGGQPGYTSFQGRWLWDRTLKHYQPDVVLVGYVVQDARKAAYSDRSQAVLQQDARYLKNNLLYRSKVYLGLRSMLGHVQVRAKERGAQDVGGEYRVPPSDYADNLRTLVAGIQDAGATPVLFGYPLEREGYTSQHRVILRAAAEELGVAHFDPQPQMDEASRGEELYFARDRGHANAAGNDRIARWVLEFLETKDLLPKEGA
jgi:lysophospholipase L1-like esterase